MSANRLQRKTRTIRILVLPIGRSFDTSYHSRETELLSPLRFRPADAYSGIIVTWIWLRPFRIVFCRKLLT